MGMIFNTLYNLTDFWFAGMVSDQALAGVSIAGSVFFMIIGIGAGMQTGTRALWWLACVWSLGCGWLRI